MRKRWGAVPGGRTFSCEGTGKYAIEAASGEVVLTVGRTFLSAIELVSGGVLFSRTNSSLLGGLKPALANSDRQECLPQQRISHSRPPDRQECLLHQKAPHRLLTTQHSHSDFSISSLRHMPSRLQQGDLHLVAGDQLSRVDPLLGVERILHAAGTGPSSARRTGRA